MTHSFGTNSTMKAINSKLHDINIIETMNTKSFFTNTRNVQFSVHGFPFA